MTLTDVLLQTLLPLVLLIAMASMLRQSLWRFALVAACVASALLAVSLTTINAYVPGWLSSLWLSIWGAVVVARLFRRPTIKSHSGWVRNAVTILCMAPGLLWIDALACGPERSYRAGGRNH